MTLDDRLRADLTTARKSKDQLAAEAIRMLINAIDNAGAVDVGPWEASHLGGPTEVPRRHITEPEILELFRGEAADYRSAAAEYRRLGRSDEADKMIVRAEVVERYLI